MKKNYWIFLLMSLFFVSQHVVAQEELSYCEPEYTSDPGNTFDRYTNTYVETITLTNGDVQLNWEKGAERAFYNVTGMSIKAKPGETVSAHLKAFSLGEYSESTVRQDLRYTALVMAIDWDHDGTFEYVEKIAGNTPPTHNVGGNMDVLDVTKEITVPADATPGVVRVRMNYTNAWFGDKTANDFVCTSKEGIVYDFDIEVAKETTGPCLLTIVQPEDGYFKVVNDETGETLYTGTEVEPSTAVRVEEMPAPGFWLKHVVVNGEPIEGKRFVIEEDVEVTVVFTDVALLSWTIEGQGSFRIPGKVDPTTESGSVELYGYKTLCFAPAEGYDLETVEIDGEDLTESLSYDEVNKEYTLNYSVPQQTEIAVRIVFAEVVKEYAVSYSVTGEGSLTLKNGETVVNSGDAVVAGTVLTGVLTYDEATVVCREVLVNEEPVTVEGKEFTFEVNQETVVSVVFEEVVYGVSFSAGENGKITVKAGDQILNSGDEVKPGTQVTVVVTPDEKFVLESLLVNDTDVAAEVKNGMYEFTVSGETTIRATFKEDESGIHQVWEGVYYNPSTKVLVAPQRAEIAVYNVVGTFVADAKGSLNMADMPNGLYLAKVMLDGGVRTVKILKK